MCMQMYLRVKKIVGSRAIMQDKREVKLGNLDNVAPGDYLEVYANIALAKVDKSQAQRVMSARQKGGLHVS